MLRLRVLLLLVAAAILAQGRDERFFPILGMGLAPPPIPRLAPSACTGQNNLNGTCYGRRTCSTGVAAGTCSSGKGICCVVVLDCGSTTTVNTTYFVNPNFPSSYSGGGRCTLTVTKLTGVNQLRLDFLELSLAQPDANGFCRTDFLSVTGGSFPVPRICGANAGNHVYVDVPSGTSSVVISVDTDSSVKFSRLWNIRILQIESTNTARAPSGCLQYFDDVSGTVTSFNYGTSPNTNSGGTPIGTREMANLNYNVCVRPAAGYCSIEWSQTSDDVYSFTVSGDTAGLDSTVLATSDAAVIGANCTGDFVIIPDALQDMVFVNADRFCGNGLTTTTSFTKPFTLGVISNDTESEPGFLPDVANRGFSLGYRQLPCPIF